MALENNSPWEFNCPQYVDFRSSAEDDGTDSYFDIDHELNNAANNVTNNLFCELRKSAGRRNAGKSLPMKKDGLNLTPATSRTKRKPLDAIQATDARPMKDYELRMTPYREERSKSYCSTYVHNSKQSLTSVTQEKENIQEKKYFLRMTPARKRNTKSCFMYRDVNLETAKFSRAYNSDDDFSSIKSEHQIENKGCEVAANSGNAAAVADVSSTSGPSKRSALPLPELFTSKRVKLSAPEQKTQKKQISNQGKKLKTAEERELMKIKQLRYELAQQRIRNEKFRNRATHINFSQKANESSASQLTVTKPFHFKTDERIKDTRTVGEYKPVDFSSLLRRQSPRMAKSKPGGLTKFQPFNFATDKRFQPYPKKNDQVVPKKKIVSYSVPHTPDLKAVKRNRPVTALNRQQIEELEAQEVKKYKFHARGFDPNVFARVVLPRVSTKPSTKPETVELATEKRFKNKEVKKSTEEKFEFHAQPVPKQILAAPTGLKPKTTVPPTEPKSPVFALKLRSQKWKVYPSVMEEPSEHQDSIFKIHPAPAPEFKAPAPFKSARKCTIMEPFSFDQKDQERAQEKERKVSEEIEKQKSVYNFKAQPIPDLSVVSGIPRKETKPVTKPEPFQLHIDELAVQKIDKWQKEIETQLAKEREVAVFKAHPAVSTKRPPFQPEKSAKPLTVSNSFPLATEKRAEERSRFHEHIQAIEADNQAHLLQLQQERERKEKEEIAALRRQTVHKARPVRRHKPFEVKPSEKPLTEPSSPYFATDLRVKQRV